MHSACFPARKSAKLVKRHRRSKMKEPLATLRKARRWDLCESFADVAGNCV